MQLFNKLASRSPKYKPGVQSDYHLFCFQSKLHLFLYLWIYSSASPKWSVNPLDLFLNSVHGSLYLFFWINWIELPSHTVRLHDFSHHNFLNVTQLQLVQFLLKQAGVEKRTGDLFGNRDLLNIARNMARGLKVCILDYTSPGMLYRSLHICYVADFMKTTGGWECLHSTSASSVSNNGEHNQREITRCGLPICWRSLSTGTVCATNFF